MSLVAVLAFSTPASAMKYVAIHYWPTSTNVSLSGAPSFRAYDTPMFSVYYRQDFGSNWAGSLSFDTGGQSNFAGTWAGASAGSNTFWNANLHRTFQANNAMMSVFVGYGRARGTSTFAGSNQTQTASGPRIGADIALQAGNFGIMAWGALGVGVWGSSEQPGFTSATGGGSMNEFGAMLTYAIGTWNLDAGYRVVNWNTPAGGSFFAVNSSTSGATFGVSKMWP
jgi:hypothetical protein